MGVWDKILLVLFIIILLFFVIGATSYIIMTLIRYIRKFISRLNDHRNERIIYECFDLARRHIRPDNPEYANNREVHDFISEKVSEEVGYGVNIYDLNKKDLNKFYGYLYELTHIDVVRDKNIDEVLKSD